MSEILVVKSDEDFLQVQFLWIAVTTIQFSI